MERLEQMVGYCKTDGCLRGWLLDYFGEARAAQCGSCGNCRSAFVERDITIPAQKILSAVARVEKKYRSGLGLTAIIQLLRGSRNRRVLQLGLDKLPTYGALADTDQRTVRSYVDRLLSEGFLELVGEEYPVLRLTSRAGAVLFHGRTVSLRERAQAPEPTRSSRRTSVPPSVPPEDATLLAALKGLRAQFAQEEDVPAYIVFLSLIHISEPTRPY